MQGGLIPAGLQVATRIGPSVIHVGDTVTVLVTAVPGEGVETPRPPLKLGPFDLLGVTRSDSGEAAHVRIHVTSFETGTRTLPPIAIAVRSGGRVDSIRTPAYQISIESLLPADTTAIDTMGVRSAMGPLELPQQFRWNVFIGYVLFLTAIVGLAYVLYRRWRNAPRAVPVFKSVEPVRPADVVALEALDGVEAKGYVERGLYKPHYTEVMDILRSYVEARFGIEALDRTSFELVQALDGSAVDPVHRAHLAGMLDEADLVKFAKLTPDSEAARRLVEEARRWVKETAPRPAPATPVVTAPGTPPAPPAATGVT
jgi:hypothetical protein